MTKFSAMNFTMTTDTKDFTIGDLKSEIGEFCPRLNMMGLEFAMIAASLAFVSISLKYPPSPLGDFRLKNLSFGYGCAAFPIEMAGAAAGRIRAFLRAILFALIICVKFVSTIPAYFQVRFTPIGPTFLRTITGKTIGFIFKFFAANLANVKFPFASVFAPDCIETIHRTKLLQACFRLKNFVANFARIFNQFLNAEIMASKESWGGKLASRAY